MLKTCDIRIAFGKPDAIYAVGEEVTGTLHLTPHRSLRPTGLRLELFWRTHGRGNRASAKLVRYDLEVPSQLEPDRTYRVPFHFLAPAGPLTYHGHLLNVDWYVRAVLGVPALPGMLEPKEKTELLLLPRAGVSVDLGSKYKPPQKYAVTGGGVRWFLVLFGAVFGGVGLLFFILMLGQLFALLPLLFVLVGVLFIFLGIRNALAVQRLGEVTFSVSPKELIPGDTLLCQVRFTPLARLKLERLRLTLKAQEKVVRGSGTDKKTYRHTVFEEVRSALSERELDVNEPVEVQEAFQIPLDAPYTFVADDNALLWSLDALIDVQGVLDWQHDAPLTVRSWHEGDTTIIG